MDTRPLRTFISYSHRDHKHRKKLREHCAQLERDGLVRLWDDRELKIGQEIDASIGAKLQETAVFILLVSPEFIASRYCESIEMKHALERHREGTALVLPIIVRPCDWKHGPLGKLVVAPEDGKPISSWDPRDAGWANATALMRAAIIELQKKRFGPGAVVGVTREPLGQATLGERPGRQARSRALIAMIAVIGVVLLVTAIALLGPRKEGPPPVLEAFPEVAETLRPTVVASDAGQPPAQTERPQDSLVELVVRSQPAATIKVLAAGRLQAKGPSPLVAHLPPGHVELEVAGSRDQPFFKRESLRLETLPRRQQHTVTVGQGEVSIRSFPASHVTVDGVIRGDVPLRLMLYEGTHTVHFECDRSTLMCGTKADVTQTVVVPAGRNLEITQRWEE